MNSKAGLAPRRACSPPKQGGYTVGVLVQCNYGQRDQLRVAGVQVGKEIPDGTSARTTGSIIVVVATDAPLIPDTIETRSAPGVV